MRKFNCTNWDKVNEWVSNNVKGGNEKFTQILKNTYYNFILDIANGVPFEHSKKSMYNVNDCVYIHKPSKGDNCDFWLYFSLNDMGVSMNFNKLGDGNTFDADKLISLIQMIYKMGKLRNEMWNTITGFFNDVDNQE